MRERHPVALREPGRGNGRERRSSLPVTVAFDSAGLLPGLRQGSLLVLDGHAGAGRRRCRSTSRSSSTTCRRAASRGTSSTARREPESCRAARRKRRRSRSARTRSSRAAAWRDSSSARSTAALTPPPVYLGEFGDVLAGSFNANYIQGLVDDRITAGCSVVPPLYCPDAPVTRAQMAVFVWKGQHGDEPPPACCRRLRRRAVPGRLRGRLHRGHRRRGRHRRLRQTATTARTRASRTRRWPSSS